MRLLRLWAVVVFAYGTTLGAQAPAPANPIADAVHSGWNGAKRNMLGAAKVMPEAKYGFRPVETVRTYGAILAHVAGANYEFCSAALGKKTPHAEGEFEKNAKTPAAIKKALQDSIEYCDAAHAAIVSDSKAAEIVDGAFGGGKQARAAVLIGNTGHNLEHYGNLVTYLRINGLVPPSSAPSQ